MRILSELYRSSDSPKLYRMILVATDYDVPLSPYSAEGPAEASVLMGVFPDEKTAAQAAVEALGFDCHCQKESDLEPGVTYTLAPAA